MLPQSSVHTLMMEEADTTGASQLIRRNSGFNVLLKYTSTLSLSLEDPGIKPLSGTTLPEGENS